MNLLFVYWGALIIGIGFFISAVWLWSGVGDWCHEYWILLRKTALIDGPPALPIIGNALHFIGDTNEHLNKFMILAKTYTTPFRVWLGPKLVVVISDPSDIEILMKSPHGTYKSSEYRFLEKGSGPGLITCSGPTQKIHRNLIMPMVNGKVIDEFIDSFENQSRRCVECLESHVNSGEFDIKPFIDSWSMDIVLDTLIGVPGTVQQGHNTELMESAIKLNSLGYERLTKIWLYPDWIYSRTGSGKEYSKAVDITRRFMNDTIAEKKKKYYDSKNCCKSSEQQSVLLDQLIAYNERHKLMDDIRLRGEVFTMSIAAQEPPSLISSFMLLMLAMHPKIQDKVRAEVQKVIGDGNVTARKLAQLKYLEMVIKETTRLFPAGVLLGREATDDIEFSSCTAPRGCSVAMYVFKTHRDPDIWNEPNKFDPDRFLPKNSVGRHPYAFVPFSGGTRGCIELLNKCMTFVKSYKTSIRVWLGPKLVLVISNPSNVETLIKSPNETYKSSGYRFIENGTGPGLLTCSGLYWWNEPNKFNPDQFLLENLVGRHPYAFVPFSGGIRGCIGKQYDIMMMKILVTRIVENFRLPSSGSLENLRLGNDLFTRFVDGYKISITKIF